MINANLNLDSFFGLELFLLGFDINEAAQLYPLQAVLALFILFLGMVFSYTLCRLSTLFDKAWSWFVRLFFAHSLLWAFFFGTALFLTGGEISVGRSLYIYTALLIITAVGQIAVEDKLPAESIPKMKTDRYGEIDTTLAKRGKIPDDA